MYTTKPYHYIIFYLYNCKCAHNTRIVIRSPWQHIIQKIKKVHFNMINEFITCTFATDTV